MSPGGVPNWIDTDAPDGETAIVEIVTLASVSVKLKPTPRAASKKVVVPGVKSSSFDWTIDEVSGAMRTEMPLATALDDANVSKTPPGCRNSRFRYVPSPRATRRRRGTAVDDDSAGASV